MDSSVAATSERAKQKPARLLHILNGDSVRMTMETANIPGTLSVWADALHDGPVPGGLAPDRLRQVRSEFWAANDWRPAESRPPGLLEQWDDGLASFPAYDEVIMWFEHDLFDQLALIHHLDFFARNNSKPARLSLICIDRFPGVEPFVGLGQLNAEQLSSLMATRQPITSTQLDLGRDAWSAFTSSDPMRLQCLIDRNVSALAFLRPALVRFLQEYPSVSSGLARTERQILTVLAEGPTSPGALFRAMFELEEAVFMGDLTFWIRVKELAGAPTPLVSLDVAERGDHLPAGTVQITDAGREVLAGNADRIRLIGLDRWLGGVHLQGKETPWRWDEEKARLVQMP